MILTSYPRHMLTVADKPRDAKVNPILDLFRDETYPGDPDLGYHAFEYLFQLGRIWSEWQSPRIGTFPLEYRDPSGPADREMSAKTGDDRAYWDIVDMLAEIVTAHHHEYIQGCIVHATAVLDRILNLHPIS